MNTRLLYSRFTSRVVLLAAAALLAIQCVPQLHAQALVVSNVWSISTSEGRSYVSATANERGVAYDPQRGFAYIVSRNGTAAKIARVDAATGADLGTFDTNGVTGGTFFLSQIGVSDDAHIYAANLTTGTGGTGANAPFKLYRWVDDGSVPVLIYSGNPLPGGNLRLGDTFDVRGSGTNTEIIAAANATNIVCVFRPTDASLNTFTVSPVLVTGAAIGEFAKGLTFGPTNTFFGRASGSATLRLCRYDFATGTGSSLRTYSIDARISAVDYDPVHNLIGGVLSPNAVSPHAVMLYNLSSGTASLIFSNAFPTPNAANANAVGGINILSNRMISVATVNGVQMTAIEDANIAVPPEISPAIGNLTIVRGGYSSYAVNTSGTKPITYQWYKDGVALTNETNTTLIFTNVTPATAGSYVIEALNFAGSAYSTGTVTISSATLSTVATPLWRIQPGNPTYPWLATDNSARGMAYNPIDNTVIVCSRTVGNSLYVLDAETGVLLRQMNFNGSGGSSGIVINMVGCARDGRVFACNVTTDASGTVPFKIYMWPSDAAGVDPTVLYEGDPGAGSHERWGDNFDVEGGGPENPDLRILAGTRNGTNVFLIRDFGFGDYAARSLIPVTGAAAGSFGLSVALGEGNTFWGKSGGNNLVQVTYDPDAATGAVTRTISGGALSVVGYNIPNRWIGGISIEIPDNVRLIDVSGPQAQELDTEISPVDNANPNGTGAVKFGIDRMFVLESNNSLGAYKLAPILRKSYLGSMLTLTWQGNHILQASGVVNTGYTNVTGASGYQVDMSNTGTTFFRLE